MCGIFGLIQKIDNHRLDFKQVLRLLHHRGPDDRGVLLWDGVNSPFCVPEHKTSKPWRVALLHTRLAILDLSRAGWQPMGTPDGRYFIVYNGEVYNYRELREELEKLGYIFRSQTDTEVVLYAYAHWGPEALKRFIGMFAFAILDMRKREVFLARDFFGIKPLYYTYLDKEQFIFSSEIKVLTLFLDAPLKANPQRVYEYLRFGLTDHAPETMFEGIFQLPAAHFMIIPIDDPERAKIVRYWSPESKETLSISFEEAVSKVREMFLNSVQLHLRSDVPVGTALSGGIDSSSIVCAVRYLNPQAEIHTFSFVAKEELGINEERWIDCVVKTTKAKSYKISPRDEELIKDIENLVYTQDEPFGSTSIYAQHLVFRLAKEHGIKVMLDGQGADELLAGYPTYYASLFLSLIRRRQYLKSIRFLKQASSRPASQGAFAIFMRAGKHLLPEFLQIYVRRLFKEDLLPSWMNVSWFVEREVVPRSLWQSKKSEALREHLLHTLTHISLPALLRYEDRNSMWYSIESRVPFLTPQFAKFVLSLPEEYILCLDGTTKCVFREAMKDIVPEFVLNRKDKIGFQTPEYKWLNVIRPWIEKVLQSETAQSIPAIRAQKLYQEWQAHGKRLTSFLWRAINLIIWTQKFNISYEK